MKTQRFFGGLVLTLALLVTASQAIGILPSSGVDTVTTSNDSPLESGFREIASGFSDSIFGRDVSAAKDVSVRKQSADLPWSTTYNCNDWTQSDGLYSVNCDGLTGYGGWTCSGGEEEQITSDANNPNGQGGKGQRHWEGDGVNNNSGGMKIDFNSSEPELWVRWYMRYESGFAWHNGRPGYDKWLYFLFGDGPDFVPEWYQSDEMKIWPFTLATTGNKGWTNIMGGQTGDGVFHCYEFHVKAGNGNGVAQLWVDGVLYIDEGGLNIGTGGWDGFVIGSNQNEPTNGRCMAVDFDDFSVCNANGPVGGFVYDAHGNPMIGPLNAATPPYRSNPSPTGTLPAGTTQTTLSLTTDENATCRYSIVPNTSYASMTNTFSTTGGTSHSTAVSGLQDGHSYTYYVRCEDGEGNANTDDFLIAFSVAESELELHGTPADQSVHLRWTVTGTLPATSTWQIAYDGPPGDQPSPITDIISSTRAYTLTGLTNYVWCTVTLNAMLDSAPFLTDTVRVMPTDIFVYLPLVLRTYSP